VTFQPEKALSHASALAQPRRVGTPGEAAAIDYVAARLAEAGCVVERQAFAFSAATFLAPAIGVGAALTLVLLTFAAWAVSAWLGAAPALLLLAVLALSGRFHSRVVAASIVPPPGETTSIWQRLCLGLGPRQKTVNVIGRVPGSPPKTSPTPLYLVAHSDSKSQALPLVARMLLIAAAGLAAAAFGVLALLRAALPGLTAAAALAGLAALLAGVPVLFLFLAGPGNASPGAIDNASGTGLVLHLAEVLAQARPGLDLTFLVTGAEELGVVGAMAYVLEAGRSSRLERERAAGLLILNFDGIGGDGRLALVGRGAGSRLGDLVRACCVELELGLGRLPLVGVLFDHVPFAEAGCDAVSLVVVGRASRAVHTPADSADKLEVEGFRQAGEVALRVVERLASRPAPASPTRSGPTAGA
jgi:hypothetical protein